MPPRNNLSLLYKVIIFSQILFILFASSATSENSIIPPYFGSIKWNKAFVRSGPGKQYPIKWEFHKKNLPVEVLRKYEDWLKIKYLDDDQGWIKKTQFSASRYVMVHGPAQLMREKPNDSSKALLIINKNVIGKVLLCNSEWCKISISEKSGWIIKKYLWGVYPEEILD